MGRRPVCLTGNMCNEDEYGKGGQILDAVDKGALRTRRPRLHFQRSVVGTGGALHTAGHLHPTSEIDSRQRDEAASTPRLFFHFPFQFGARLS